MRIDNFKNFAEDNFVNEIYSKPKQSYLGVYALVGLIAIFIILKIIF